MKQTLSNNQLEYVFFHLAQHVELDAFKSHFCYSIEGSDKGIWFVSCEDQLDFDFSLVFQGNDLSVLFPGDKSMPFYTLTDGSLVYHHDLLKSAFYLLSGYQEINASSPDDMGRFMYEGSVQEKLKIAGKPVVNYYFEIIISGLEEYGRHHGIELRRKRLFDNFGFMLTHDVDRVKYHHWRETAYKFLQLLGMRKAHYAKNKLFKAALKSILPTILPGVMNDPWWNFEEMRELERSFGYKSVWYFLNQDQSPQDAKYQFSDSKIRDLITWLSEEGCEIGLHGSIKTAMDEGAMNKALRQLEKVCSHEIVGTRQHFLKMHYPETLTIQQVVGLKYDTTLGFADYEGFRNSYCYPFHPYDHANDRMMDFWEIPLTVMDGTLLGYRELSFKEMYKVMRGLCSEIQCFGGVFVLLWHNCNFDEYQYPGIRDYYQKQLAEIKDMHPQSVTGKDVISKL